LGRHLYNAACPPGNRVAQSGGVSVTQGEEVKAIIVNPRAVPIDLKPVVIGAEK
jgi:hypothetical protein